MKLTILFILLSFTAGATNRYFTIGGSDLTGTGAIGFPYASYGKAASVAVIGDSILAGPGTFAQVTQVNLAGGVNVRGTGITTKIILNFTVTGSAGFNSAAVMLASPTEGTNGNQSISDIWFDGNGFACYSAILVRRRSNVIIQRCRFTNFAVTAINLNGKTSNTTGAPPSTFATGNQVLNCTILDCNDRVIQSANSVSCGSITFSGQANLLCLNDTIRNINKTPSHNGDNFCSVQGNNYGFRLINCVSEKPPDEGTGFNCHIENWYDMGGCEISGCTFLGGGLGLDLGYGSANKGDSAHSWNIHDNTVSNPALLTFNTSWPVGSIFISFESTTNIALRPKNKTDGDAWIHNNNLQNIGTIVGISMNNYTLDTIKNIKIDHNYGSGFGYANNVYSGVIPFTIKKGSLIDSIDIINNTFVSATGPGATKGFIILEPDTGKISHINAINNIFLGNTVGAPSGYAYLVFRGNYACDNISDQNNIKFDNAFTNNPFVFTSPAAPAPTNFTNINGIKLDPLFVSTTDFHLSAHSPGIGNGLNPPATYIGAFPPGTTVPTFNWTPADLVFTNAIGASQLNAVAMDGVTVVPGIHLYSPAAGFTPPSVGPLLISDLFTPTDQTTYSVVSTTRTINVTPKPATINFLNLRKKYNQLPQFPDVVTVPAGLPYSVTLDGVTGGRINANDYDAYAQITSPNYSATAATGTFTIYPDSSAVIHALDKTVFYDGNRQTITGTTTPAGILLAYLYDGVDTPGVEGPGTTDVTIFTASDNYWAPVIHRTLTINVSSKPIFISDTIKTYTGSAQGVTVTSDFPYDLTGSPQTAAGDYQVIAHINDGINVGSDTATLHIAKRTPVLSWTAPAPKPLGSLLTTSDLNATSDVAGHFTYSHVLGEALPLGVTNVIGTFIPDDPSNNNGGTISINISVVGENPFTNPFYIIGPNGVIYIQQ